MNMIRKLLIIDDDIALCRSIELQLKLQNIETEVTNTAEAGLAILQEYVPDLVLLDVNLPDADGLSVLQKIRDINSSIPVVIITARQDMGITITAMKSGAFDYIRKPFDIDDVLLVIGKARRVNNASASMSNCGSLEEDISSREIIGSHSSIIEVLKQIGMFAGSNVSVLIRGESGTGKELVARAIHEAASPQKPFVAVNCSAIVSTLLESELFGHEKGSFTGADKQKIGKLELAGDGTIFFDEIGDMALDLQAKLLRVLQEREFERVGGTKTVRFKARVLFATHRDLQAMVADKAFREDLLYRITVSEIVIPPLRDRRSDITVLVNYFISKLGIQLHKNVDGIEEAAMRRLELYDWPGNVRELENILTRAIALSRTHTIGVDDIKLPLGGISDDVNDDIMPLSIVEKDYIAKALLFTNWNITKTAKLLEISPTTLRKKINDYGIADKLKKKQLKSS